VSSHPRAAIAASIQRNGIDRGIFAVICLCVLSLTVFLGGGASSAAAAETESCPNEDSRQGPSSALPDCRVYEAVSPVATEGIAATYIPGGGADYTDLNSRSGGISTDLPFMVAPDGETVVYPGDPPPTGGGGSSGESNGDQYLARRSPGGGWTQADIQPLGLQSPFRAFSTDLSLGILDSFDPLTADAPANCVVLYSRTNGDGAFHPLFTETQTPGECGGPRLTGGISADDSQLLFDSTAALIPSAVAGKTNLYDSFAGHVHLVNVLPGGEPAPRSAFGSSRQSAKHEQGVEHAISTDDSRIFWTAVDEEEQPEALYVRENATSPGAATVQLDVAQAGAEGPSGGGDFRTASPDGSKVFFTDENRLTVGATAEAGSPDLYEYDFEAPAGARLADLTPVAGADVQGLLGASADGSYVYFAAGGVLAGNENGEGETAAPGSCEAAESTPGEEEERHGHIPPGRGCNIYLFHRGDPLRFIATLLAADNGGFNASGVLPFDGGPNGEHLSGAWQASPGQRTAEVTPGGRSLIFMSNRSLTGYDTEVTRAATLDGRIALQEVFLYEAGADQLRCVSCDPGGEPPAPTEFYYREVAGSVRPGPVGAYFPISKTGSPGDTHQVHGITDDGSRIFFDSGEPLAPQDTNGWMDVYEWERNGTGSCHESVGCIYLLSGGTSSESSWLLGADASGDNAFIITTGQLTAQDHNENDDVYDARVDGVSQAEAPICEGESCREGTVTTPAVQSPPSAGFYPGNQTPGHHKKKHRRRRHKEQSVKKHHRRAGHSHGGGK
jgi:hypothetical protein